MSKVKVRIMFGLTSRQLVCFGTAAVIGIPTYFLTRGAIGNSSAVLLMIGLMLPAFFIAMFEKDGQPAEKILPHVIRLRWFFPSKRPYKTENFYETIEREVLFESKTNNTGTAENTPASSRHPSGKQKSTPTRTQNPSEKARRR